MAEVVTELSPDGFVLKERVQRVEWEHESIKKRLAEGAKSFSEVRTGLEQIKDELKPKPTPLWKMVSVAITIGIIVCAWVWQAAKYPDRAEFNRVHQQVESLKLEQVEIRADVKSIKESQARTEEDMRELLRRSRPE